MRKSRRRLKWSEIEWPLFARYVMYQSCRTQRNSSGMCEGTNMEETRDRDHEIEYESWAGMGTED